MRFTDSQETYLENLCTPNGVHFLILLITNITGLREHPNLKVKTWRLHSSTGFGYRISWPRSLVVFSVT